MPYISKDKRARLLVETEIPRPRDAGELNYIVSSIMLGYLKRKGVSYQTFNDMIGALECAKMEFYRRQLLPYENAKREANGDLE